MKYKLQNTLGYFLSAPQTQLVNMEHFPLPVIAQSVRGYRETCGLKLEGAEAIQFYGLNHFASIVMKDFTLNEPLPEWAVTIMTRYSQELAQQSQRMFGYLLCITTQEARHMYSMPSEWWDSFKAEFGHDIWKWIKTSCNEDRLMSEPPQVPTGRFCRAIRHMFYTGKWAGGYGGPAWGAVSDCLVACVEGKTSLEMMVDTGYTLQHNNGPIFNKHMMYSGGTGASQMLRILDVQRSGQIPELLMDKKNWVGSNRPDLSEYVKIMTMAKPDEFGGWVDWQKVMDLGSVGKYHTELSVQLTAHPKKKEPVVIGSSKMIDSGETFDIGPGESVAIFTRVA